VKKSLSALSRALGAQIVSFEMVDPSKPEKKPKVRIENDLFGVRGTKNLR